ncbi:MAG: M2 family metallopeptidase [Acidobacteriia bacterium]|nr:M2 family metallopeptidase [Terriglobia bacterium]
MRKPVLGAACLMLAACGRTSNSPDAGSLQFLGMYNQIDQRLYATASQASWRAATDVTEQHTGERIGADAAHASFRGSRYVIENARRLLASRDALTDLEFRQLDKILLNAAESPGTIPDVVQARIQAEARLSAVLDGFTFCMEPRGGKCAKPTDPNRIDEALLKSRDLSERRKYWEVSKQTGPALKAGLGELRDLRNRVSKELGYSSYFHLQVADYGMSVNEMIQLMDKTLLDLKPLYGQLHLYARNKLSQRYKQPVPERIPAHWIGNRWGQQWPGLVEAADLDPYFRKQTPLWIVQQAERFYTSLGMKPLPGSFWEKSDLYQLPAGSTRKKNTHASAWHIDRAADVRSLMSVIPNSQWFETSHHELGHVYYYIAYSNPKVPHVLREGLNRAFHEAVGDLIGIAARQEPYLRQTGILPASVKLDATEYLLSEALDSAVVFLPWSAGTMTHFEYELYEKSLPVDQFNRRWWEMVRNYQVLEPPSARGEEFCDACTKTHIIDDPAQYYDYALAFLIKYQLHDYIARKILKQDPHHCNYYGNQEVGRWLTEILSLGATRDWRTVIREKTGEDIGTRAMLEYFKPLREYLDKANARKQD